MSNISIKDGDRNIRKFGEEEDVTVLHFESKLLNERHQQFLDGGASSDYSYKPHLTLSYTKQNTDNVLPFTGILKFGGEIFAPIDLD